MKTIIQRMTLTLTAALTTALTLHSGPATAGGTWVALANQPLTSTYGIGVMLLLSDGTVMCVDGQDNKKTWYRLTPDQQGSYVNGTWSTMPTSHNGRALFASDVLPDGTVFVAGGEYGGSDGSGKYTAETYDPVANNWTLINPPTSLFDPSAGNIFSDMISIVTTDGNVLMAPVTPKTYGGTLIYNPKTKVWSAGPLLVNNDSDQDECGWVLLADGSILTIDACQTTSQRFIPSLNEWKPDGTVPVNIWNTVGSGCEIGPALTLPDGEAFYVAGTGANVLYKPSGNTSPGTWRAGPVTPNNLESADCAGAVMINGKVLMMAASSCFNGGCDAPWFFYEFNYTAGPNGSLTAVSAPSPALNSGLYIPCMLDLPDGTVLLSAGSSQLYVYQPDGSPLTAGKPTITSITKNADGSYHLVGTGLNGITIGANEGDDAQMATDYPLVRLTTAGCGGQVYYARTYNWSSTSIQTGSTPESTEFKLPAGLPANNYSLEVVANGIASDPVEFRDLFEGVLIQPVSLFPPHLVLTWANSPDAQLQSETSLTGSWNTIVGATSPYTIPILSFPQQFFRACAPFYIGNCPSDPTGAPDGVAKSLVILGEYRPASPLAVASPSATLTTGTVGDVKFYGKDYNFTLYALSLVENGPGANQQTFKVVASQSFSGSNPSPGTYTLPVSGFSVSAGDILAFAGTGPYYPQSPNDATGSDATYYSVSGYLPPGGETQFTVGANGDSSATYQYIADNFGNQGRTYAIGVDILGP